MSNLIRSQIFIVLSLLFVEIWQHCIFSKKYNAYKSAATKFGIWGFLDMRNWTSDLFVILKGITHLFVVINEVSNLETSQIFIIISLLFVEIFIPLYFQYKVPQRLKIFKPLSCIYKIWFLRISEYAELNAYCFLKWNMPIADI